MGTDLKPPHPGCVTLSKLLALSEPLVSLLTYKMMRFRSSITIMYCVAGIVLGAGDTKMSQTQFTISCLQVHSLVLCYPLQCPLEL